MLLSFLLLLSSSSFIIKNNRRTWSAILCLFDHKSLFKIFIYFFTHANVSQKLINNFYQRKRNNRECHYHKKNYIEKFKFSKDDISSSKMREEPLIASTSIKVPLCCQQVNFDSAIFFFFFFKLTKSCDLTIRFFSHWYDVCSLVICCHA